MRRSVEVCQEFRNGRFVANCAVTGELLHFDSALIHEFDFPMAARRRDYNHERVPPTFDPVRRPPLVKQAEKLTDVHAAMLKAPESIGVRE
jgi:hypothetical protein